MAEFTNPLVTFSDHAAQLVERAASSIVAVHGVGRGSSSGIHWRSGVIVTAEEVLERDEDIKITLPGGREVEASLAGRDPTTDVAVLQFQPDGLPTASTLMRRRCAGVTSSWRSEIMRVLRLPVSASSPPWDALGMVFVAVPSDSLIRLDLVSA
jgi:S1-C subfamily serine protease